MSLFVAGAVFGDVELALFVAGAVFGEIWNDSRSAKCCNFQYKMLIMLGSWSDRPRIGNDVSSVFSKFF